MLRCLLFCFSVFAILGATSAQADTIAKVVATLGSASASGRAITAGSDIAEHDKISVGPGGNVQLQFTDGTRMVIGPNSTLVVEKYLMQGGGTAKDLSVNALRGTFRFITGQSPKSAYDIKTANSTIGIRGTGFDFWVDNRTGVVVLVGRVRLCAKAQCVEIEQGCHAGISQPGDARKLEGFILSNSINNHLPYLLDQSQLRERFRLPIEACDRIIQLGSGQGAKPPGPAGRKCGNRC